MALVAIAFMSGQAERGTMGGRIALAVVAGLILYFLDQVTMQVGLLWGIRPAAVAFAPSAVAWLAAISRFRWSAA
jgi:lipopolysaccharide export LptBFGC system permease protein LptF